MIDLFQSITLFAILFICFMHILTVRLINRRLDMLYELLKVHDWEYQNYSDKQQSDMQKLMEGVLRK